MAVLIGGITAKDTVPDDSTLHLQYPWGVYALTIGDSTYVYSVGEGDDGVSAFELGSDGLLTNVQNIDDDATLELEGADNFASVTVGDTTFLFVDGYLDDGISAFRVNADGTLSNTDNVTDDATLNLDFAEARMGTATVGGNAFLIASGENDDGISVFQVNADGTLSNTDNVSDGGDLQLGGAEDVTTATVGDHTFVFVAGENDNGVSVFELDANGNLTNTDNVTDNATLNLGGAYGVAAATVGGTTYLIASGQTDDGLSVFSVSDSGQLTNVFNVSDSATRGLDDPHSITPFTIDEETFISVSGTGDSALAIFYLGADGSLTDVTTIFDTATTALGGTITNAFAEVDGTPILIGAGYDESGLTTFDIGSGDDVLSGTDSNDLLLGLAGNDDLAGGDGDDDLHGDSGDDHLDGGSGNDGLDGGSGNDLLDGGAGNDAMAGGEGDDTYVVDVVGDTVTEEGDQGHDTVQSWIDYALGDNVEDLLLLGSANLSGTGNGLDNGITGNGGKNDLLGKGGEDHLYGEGGKDDLDGGGANDHLWGGKKADGLFGGKGKDVMEGQGGNDDFIYTKLNQSGTSSGTRDHIDDFKNKDDIDVSAIDAVKGEPGDQAFVLDQDGVFEAGEIRFRSVNAGVIVELNVDNDAKAEMSILLKDFVGTLNNSDFDF